MVAWSFFVLGCGVEGDFDTDCGHISFDFDSVQSIELGLIDINKLIPLNSEYPMQALNPQGQDLCKCQSLNNNLLSPSNNNSLLILIQKQKITPIKISI